ncbi:hypothetical protein BD770DRAFT_447189 [Pilaira anomala]|nr:hypothetical protein BD770DRAFT_447189 [Pilaira anomala]
MPAIRICTSCNQEGHSRSTSRRCLNNPNANSCSSCGPTGHLRSTPRDCVNNVANLAEIATGPNRGTTFLIPRIDVVSNEAQTTIPFKRRQFPVRPAFAMTINKAQGQTLDSLGLLLTSPVFSHEQLYVAFSRVKQPKSIKILLDRNIQLSKIMLDPTLIISYLMKFSNSYTS